MKKVVVIGAGASGMVSAIFASFNNEVILLEKNNECGKKILVTGNGRCNYFNENQDISHYHSKSNNINKIINENNIKEILKFFDTIGIIPQIKNGYYYPYSNSASSIRESLLLKIKERNIQIINNYNVEEIKKTNDKFIINNDIQADKIILSSGSFASIKDKYNGYELGEKLNHTIIKPLPSLVKLLSNENYFKYWNGVRCDALLSLYENGKFIKEERGELQLTNDGISGICTFNLSNYVSKGLDENKKEEIYINFLPIIDKNSIINYIEERNNKLKGRKINELFETILNYKLINTILRKINIDINKTWKDLTKLEKNNLVNNLCDLKINILETNKISKAQVCIGGISLDEINPNTMESLKQENLYITGELLDVNGDCGGYNLSFAWITGMIAGKSV